MSNSPSPLRPGMTALAAVAALSATSAFAQATDPAATAVSVPVIAAPPPPVISAAPAPTPAVTSAVTPAFSGATRSTPIYHQPDTSDETASSVPARPERSLTSRATVKRAVAAVAPAIAPEQAKTVATPAAAVREAKPAPAPVAQPAPVKAAAAPIASNATTIRTSGVDPELLPVAGTGAAALLLIGGGIAVFRRRRRDEEVAGDEYELTATEAAPPVAAPTLAAAPAMSLPTVIREQRPSNLPAGFDLSRFGRHMQAAYRGPTPENPSFSLRRRLKRASFFDGRERMAAETGMPVADVPVAAAARSAQPASARDDGQIVIRPRPTKAHGDFFRPAFSTGR